MADYKEEHINNTREYKLKTKLTTCQNLIEFSSNITNFRNAICDNIISYSIEILKELIVFIYDNGMENKKRIERSKHIINNNLLVISSLLEILSKQQIIKQKDLSEFERYYEILRINNEF